MTAPSPAEPLRFCPRCAGRLELRPAGDARLPHPVCSNCEFVLWQSPKPCVDALIVRASSGQIEVLLGRLPAGAQERWDAPGNFLNIGDRIEDALRRECRREMGVEIAIDHVLGAFDDEYRGTPIVTIVYECRVSSGEPRAADLIDEVRWFELDDLPPLASASTREAIAVLRERRSRRAPQVPATGPVS